MDLEIAIINLISQIPMSIWLCNDGQIAVASTARATGIQCLTGKRRAGALPPPLL